MDLFFCPWCETRSIELSGVQFLTGAVGEDIDAIAGKCHACRSRSWHKVTQAGLDTVNERKERKARKQAAATSAAMAEVAGS